MVPMIYFLVLGSGELLSPTDPYAVEEEEAAPMSTQITKKSSFLWVLRNLSLTGSQLALL